MNIQEIQKKQSEQEKNSKDLEKEYPTVVVKVREVLTTKYREEILNNFGKADQKEMLTAYIKSIVVSSFSDYNTEEFIERIYQDIFGLVFIEKYLNRDDFEEMNGNSWNDIEATGYDVEKKKIKGRILFKFFKTVENGVVKGTHQQINVISNKLCQTLFENGCEIETIQKYNSSFTSSDKDDYIEDYIEA